MFARASVHLSVFGLTPAGEMALPRSFVSIRGAKCFLLKIKLIEIVLPQALEKLLGAEHVGGRVGDQGGDVVALGGDGVEVFDNLVDPLMNRPDTLLSCGITNHSKRHMWASIRLCERRCTSAPQSGQSNKRSRRREKGCEY